MSSVTILKRNIIFAKVIFKNSVQNVWNCLLRSKFNWSKTLIREVAKNHDKKSKDTLVDACNFVIINVERVKT